MVLDLSQICPEALKLFDKREIPHATARAISRMKPAQQVKVAELMISVNNLTVPFARAVLLATPRNEYKHPVKRKPVHRVKAVEQKTIQKQTAALHTELKSVQGIYDQIMLNQIVAAGFAKRLIGNERIADYLRRHHPNALDELNKAANNRLQ